MSPTLHPGQIIFVNRLSYLFKKPKVNDIVAAKIDKKVFIKRITKIEGSMIYLRGDNSNDSIDSKIFGFVSREQLIGKVLY